MYGFYFDRIIYFSGQGFPNFNQIHGIYIEKINNLSEDYIKTIDSNSKTLIVLDDNMYQVTNDLLISDLFTKLSHHLNITVILLVQNLFPKSKFMRDISMNSTYLVLMSNPREKLQIKTLSTQIDGSDFILNAFIDATSNIPFGYLFLDFEQNTPDEIRVRSYIFPNEKQIVYIKISKVC